MNTKSNKTISNYIFAAVLTLEIYGCFIFQEANAITSRYASLISFILLSLLLLPKLKYYITHPAEFKNDPFLLILICGGTAALLNLFLIGSNKGAFLTAATVMMAFYIGYDYKCPLWLRFYTFCILSSLLIWWYCHVHWYFNFNMAGFIFMLTGIAAISLIEILIFKNKCYETLRPFQIIAYITATLLCLLYHARCVLAGMLLFGILYSVMPVILNHKLAKHILISASTFGSLIFSALYILLDKTGISITILYKDILSGRQDIWGELWTAFSKQPFTGIGSSYEIKSFFIFEVHNGMLDLLIVHGIPVFICAMLLIYRTLLKALSTPKISRLRRIALSAVFAMLFTSFFENFFINSPYLLIMLLFIADTDN